MMQRLTNEETQRLETILDELDKLDWVNFPYPHLCVQAGDMIAQMLKHGTRNGKPMVNLPDNWHGKRVKGTIGCDIKVKIVYGVLVGFIPDTPNPFGVYTDEGCYWVNNVEFE